MLAVQQDHVVGEGVEAVVHGVAAHEHLLGDEGDEHRQGRSGQAPFDLDAVETQRQRGHQPVLLLEVQPGQKAVVGLGDAGRLGHGNLQLLPGLRCVQHQEGHVEHSLVAGLQIGEQVLRRAAVGGEVRRKDVHIVAAAHRPLLLLYLHGVQVGDLPLDHFDSLVLVDASDVHGHHDIPVRLHEVGENNEVEGGVRVAHNEEQRRFPVAQGIQLQFIVRHDLPKLRNIEGGKAGAAANQDGFQGLAGSQFEFAVLLHSEVVRVLLLQFGKEQVNGALKFLVVLSGLRCVDELQQREEVLFLRLRLVPDVPDQGAVQKPLGLDPKILGGFFSVAFGVGNDNIDQFEDVFLRPDIGEGVVFHAFFEVDGVEDLDAVRLIDDLSAGVLHGLSVLVQLGGAPPQHGPHLGQKLSFW